jgi:uroporphyrin-III C-methyltransferase
VSGKVYLVGAGPGDADLLTVRAARLLAEADVVVHDRLIGPGTLEGCRPDAELIDVSKRPGDGASLQTTINGLLVDRALAGFEVVRLKGGDPFVFGRGGEEAIALADAGVPYEIVPGVSSALAAPAAAGIPATHRDLARSLTVVTGHRAALDDHDWRALAASDTLVVLMGAATVGEIAARLLEAGASTATPVAVIQKATLPDQRDLRTTLGELSQAMSAAGLEAPLVLVVGAVAALDVRSRLLLGLLT